MLKAKLTRRIVESVTPSTADIVVWDTEVKGFGLKVTPKGARSYFLYYRTRSGAQRKPRIGLHGDMTADQARHLAQRWRLEVATGGDPSALRQTDRQSPTMAVLCDTFLSEHSAVRNKPATRYNYERQIETIIKPQFGTKKVADVTAEDLRKLHHELRDRPTQANRVLSLLCKMLNLAERWGWRPDNSNPARKVEKYRENRRSRHLSPREIKRLDTVLRAVEQEGREHPSVASAIRMLLLTGCRLSEVLNLRWRYIVISKNKKNGRIDFPDSKTGAKSTPLNEVAIGYLRFLRSVSPSNRDFVFPGALPGRPLVNLQKPWRRIRRRANLTDVRLHDLRHTTASIAVGRGVGLPIIGKILGHKQAQTTLRYSHVADEPARAAANEIGDELKVLMPGLSRLRRLPPPP